MRLFLSSSLLVVGVLGACGGADSSEPPKSTGASTGGTSQTGGSNTPGSAGGEEAGTFASVDASKGGGGTNVVADSGPGPLEGASASCSKYLAASPKSEWVSTDASGKLVYKKLPAGDQIMDFSFAGYGGGGVRIPEAPMATSVAPTGG